jgi:hypothetical protein
MEAGIEGKGDGRLLGAGGEDAQRHRGGIPTGNSKVDAPIPPGRPQRQWMASVQFDLSGASHEQRFLPRWFSASELRLRRRHDAFRGKAELSLEFLQGG